VQANIIANFTAHDMLYTHMILAICATEGLTQIPSTIDIQHWTCPWPLSSAMLQGKMVVSLAELKRHTKMEGKKKLQHGSSPDGRLDLEMSWNSYLGLDDD